MSVNGNDLNILQRDPGGAEAKLERRLSPLNVWALALGCIIGWGAFVMPGNTFLPTAGPLGTIIAMVVAAAILIIIAFNYSYMICKYPVAGGEFTYTNAAFGKTHAFIGSWFLGLCYLSIVPLNATALALIGRNLMGGVFQVGYLYEIAGYSIYAGEIFLALIALAVFAWLSIRGVKFSGMFQTGLVFLLVAGVVVVVVAALISPDASFDNLVPLYSPGNSEIAGILAVVAVAPWAFVGFDTIPQSAEEMKFSPAKSKALMIVSIIFGALIYAALNTITAAVVPDGYATWADYIAAFGDLEGIMALPTFNAAHILLGDVGVALLGIAVACAILSGLCGFYMAASRMLFAMARESVLPAWFGKLHPKYNTPYHAIIFIMVIAMVAPFFGRTALGWIVDMASFGAAIGYGYTSLAATKCAISEKRWTIVISGVLGSIFALTFCILLLVPIEMFGCNLGAESMICLIVWAVLGAVFFFATKKTTRIY